MTNVFDLREAEFGLPGVGAHVVLAKSFEDLAEIGEECLWVGGVYEYIIDVYFAYAIDKSYEDLVRHTALKVRASSFQSHSHPGPLI